MLSDILKNNSAGRLSSGIEKKDSVKSVISFLRKHLHKFAAVHKGDIHVNEKGLTQQLCIYLNKQARTYPYFFHNEFIENINDGLSPQVDIGTISYEDNIEIMGNEYYDQDSFFSLEAKRLPTTGSRRQKEYVIGNKTQCGGIERFKISKHGQRLSHAGIIGYVQKETYEFWINEINTWIEEIYEKKLQAGWSADDKLQLVEIKGELGEFFSENSRVGGSKVALNHFWLNLCN